jgi:hypothetical protein
VGLFLYLCDIENTITYFNPLKMKNEELKLRDVIFSLHTRKFGNVVEKLVETILIEFGFIVKKSTDLSYDRQINSSNDEIKGSRVLGKSVLNLENENIIESLFSHDTNRFVNIENSSETEWDCNIQQIKLELFNTLWYVLFFGDCVAVFKIERDNISNDKNISYSNKQHRGNEGEGQFHVTNKNIKYHLDNFLVKTITYNEVYNKLNEKNK